MIFIKKYEIMENIKPTFKEPVSPQSEKFEKDFKKSMVSTTPNINLVEIDSKLNKDDYSIKKKIFSLPKMESLVFSDPMLSGKYEEMSEEGVNRWGYHYNETIMNILFNDYVLNSLKYLQKYKMAIPKEKKRRDKSGINQLKKAGEKKMTQSGLAKLEKTDVEETSLGAFTSKLDNKDVDESSTAGSAGGAAGYTGYAGPSAWSKSGDLMDNSKKEDIKIRKPIWKGGTVIQESNYLTDSSGFEKYIDELNESINFELAKDEALKISREEGVAQHVNQIPNDNYKVSDWYDADSTIFSCEDGRELNEESDADFVLNNSQAYGSIDNMSPEDQKVIKTDIQNGKLNSNANIKDGIALQEKAKSKSQQHFMGMVNAVQKGELSPDEVGSSVVKAANSMTNKDVDDFASTKHKGLPEKVDEINQNNIKEDTQTMIQNNGTSMSNKAQATGDISIEVPVGTQTSGGLNESDFKLLEDINKELEAFSIHHDKLKLMSEERKTNSQILNQRVGDENSKNFKKDFQDSDTKDIIDVEKELEHKDQQTDVPKDPQKLGQDIEKQAIKNSDMEGDEALKNVGDSTNDNGDEVPKRNLTTDEQEEVDLYRNGQHSLVYDNEPDKRFDDRMKADMGEDIYKMREKQLEFKGKAPMYNKDTQPVEDGTDKVQFNKDKSGWNEREGLKESMITGRYIDILGKRRLMEFRLNEVTEVEKLDENITMELGFDGLGNTYMSKTVDKKVIVNESVVNAISSHKYYTDGESVVAIKNPTQSLNEGEVKEEKLVINEQMDKMKHLLGYKPDSFVNTKNVKKNRGF